MPKKLVYRIKSRYSPPCAVKFTRKKSIDTEVDRTAAELAEFLYLQIGYVVLEKLASAIWDQSRETLHNPTFSTQALIEGLRQLIGPDRLQEIQTLADQYVERTAQGQEVQGWTPPE